MRDDVRSRARGCLVGLAVGDALGAAVEFQLPGTFAPVTGMRDGGPHRLKAGEWTDDATTTTEADQATAVTTPTTTPTTLPFTGQNSIEILVIAIIAFVLGVGFLRIGQAVGTKQD